MHRTICLDVLDAPSKRNFNDLSEYAVDDPSDSKPVPWFYRRLQRPFLTCSPIVSGTIERHAHIWSRCQNHTNLASGLFAPKQSEVQPFRLCLPSFVGITLAFVFVASAFGAPTSAPSNLRGTGYNIGDTPFDFTGVDQLGNQVSLYKLYGESVVLDYGAVWCTPCNLEASQGLLSQTVEQRDQSARSCSIRPSIAAESEYSTSNSVRRAALGQSVRAQLSSLDHTRSRIQHCYQPVSKLWLRIGCSGWSFPNPRRVGPRFEDYRASNGRG
jgi:hypothetical protein